MKYNVPITAEFLRTYRRINGLTRRQMAKRAGMSEPYLFKVEKEKKPILPKSEITMRDNIGISDAELVKFNALTKALEGSDG